ncbi:MAG: cupin domain-containing protein [Desulfococcaceae bacterium]
MKPRYFHQTRPFPVPTDDGKTISEHFGLASTGNEAISIAHMIAPPGWEEPPQTPEFDEFILMVSGRKMVEIEDREIVLEAGESMRIEKGLRVRYSNPFDEIAEYWCVCLPAFSPETVHREEE